MIGTHALPPLVLVHGGFLGGWLYDAALPEFEALGVEAHAPTLKGLGERADEAIPELGVTDQATDLVEFLADVGKPVVLVGHSYAGVVVTKAADLAPDLIDALVVLDGFVPGDGDSLLDLVEPAAAQAILAQVEATGWEVGHVSRWAIDDPDLVEFVAERLTPQSGGTVTEKLRLAGAYVGPRVHVSLTDRQKPHFVVTADRLRDDPAWAVRELPGTHLDMVVDPRGFATGLLDVLRSELSAT